jgi:hypothetical protein
MDGQRIFSECQLKGFTFFALSLKFESVCHKLSTGEDMARENLDIAFIAFGEYNKVL